MGGADNSDSDSGSQQYAPDMDSNSNEALNLQNGKWSDGFFFLFLQISTYLLTLEEVKKISPKRTLAFVRRPGLF
jgi:hypothetical protein